MTAFQVISYVLHPAIPLFLATRSLSAYIGGSKGARALPPKKILIMLINALVLNTF